MTVWERIACISALACLGAVGLCAGAETVVIDSFDYANADAARKAWTPVVSLLRVSHMPPVAVTERGEGHALRLPCPFTRNVQRSLYHRDLKMDLSNAARVEFDLYVDRPGAVGSFTLYFISGDGCYRGMAGAGAPGWRRVRLNKASFKPEGTPDGWANISAMRFSPWKGAAADTYCLVDNLVAKTAGEVAIVIGTYAAREFPKEAASVYNCAERVASLLDRAGVMACTMESEDVARGQLAGKKVAILPYSPRLSEAEGQALRRFVDGGGKLVTFYVLPPPLPELLGVRKVKWQRRERDGQFLDVDLSGSGIVGMPERIRQNSGCIYVFEPAAKHARVIGRWVDRQGQAQPQPGVILSDAGVFMAHTLLQGDMDRKRQFLVALVGHVCPSAWAEAAHAAMARATEVGPFTNRPELERYLRSRAKGHPRATEAQAAVAQARKLLAGSEAHIQAQRWVEAVAAAQAARERFLCPPRPARSMERTP